VDPADNHGRRLLEWSVAAKPFPGETVAGDRAVVACSDGRALVAAVDGLGHGREAVRAAETAVGVLQEFAEEPVVSLVQRCHEALRATRGAALSLASFSERDGSMTWLGVGNVDGRIVAPRRVDHTPNRSLLVRPGLAGHELPPLACATVPVRLGDMLFLATDGISRAFADSTDVFGSTRAIADRILEEHAKPTDDALVVVARYLGVKQ
jgi:negative regulator of sigma-B (phosphoserine phosphatase)